MGSVLAILPQTVCLGVCCGQYWPSSLSLCAQVYVVVSIGHPPSVCVPGFMLWSVMAILPQSVCLGLCCDQYWPSSLSLCAWVYVVVNIDHPPSVCVPGCML